MANPRNFYFVYQVCSENPCSHHVITAPAQTFMAATKLRSSRAEVFRKKGFLTILQNPLGNICRNFFFRYLGTGVLITFAFTGRILVCDHSHNESLPLI